ncbi:hypothetical protein [Peptostreptococcus equinus]|uniref:Uncharacterized protein n=1 Tax=Peptostreptococcus equinus TaxID=3003601 RepID=A0ABY7JUA6_9FIRM|nr:hypothetical protein [Peptostreptococcus sp. CBA3647]WAW15482.1 hypothetical protein O0R46_03285 [Peptostreptococcus sp. CBA3647]
MNTIYKINELFGKKINQRKIVSILLKIFVFMPILFLIYKSIRADNMKNAITIYSLLSIISYFLVYYVKNKYIKFIAMFNMVLSVLNLFLFLTIPTVLEIAVYNNVEVIRELNIKELINNTLIYFLLFIIIFITNRIEAYKNN